MPTTPPVMPTATTEDHTHAPPLPPSSLRARKLSLSMKVPPVNTAVGTNSSSASSSIASPVSATSPQYATQSAALRTSNRAPAPSAPSEVGLGLMLDTHSGTSSARESFESDAGLLVSWPATNGKSITDASRFGQSPSTTDEFEGGLLISSSNNASVESFGQQRKPLTAANGRASSSSSTRGLPRLSTVTTASGTTSSPLMIFTGSPNPSSSLGTTPRILSPSPNRSPSPSHSALHMGSNGVSSRPTTPSRPNATFASSVPMDRTTSASKSREIHGRQQSLTSACPPVTSSYGTPDSHVGSSFSSLIGNGGGNGAGNGYSSSPPKRSWRVFDWQSGARHKETSSGRSSDDDEDPRAGAKGAASLHPPPSTLTSILNLPANLLALFLMPLYATSPNGHHYSPTLNGASSASAQKAATKRYPLPVRLLTLGYLAFSVVFFGAHVHSWATGHDSAAARNALSRATRIRLPRDAGVGDLSAAGLEDQSGGFGLPSGVGHWAHRVANGGGWWSRAGDEGADGTTLGEEVANTAQFEKAGDWGLVRRLGDDHRGPDQNPLSPLTHTYRFSKMHDKIHWDLPDEIIPFAFHAASEPPKDSITACLYSNEAWLNHLPAFVSTWDGPVSLVFESSHSRTSPEHAAVIETIAALRDQDELVRQYVNFHIIGTPATTSERTLNKTRERMIERPMAQNYHINLARFFASTDAIFVVGDARITPSPGLHRRLRGSDVHTAVMEQGDAVIVPTFGFVRDATGDMPTAKTLHDLRSRLDLPMVEGAWDGVAPDEFAALANERIVSLYETLPVPPTEWPSTKRSLTSQVNTRIPTPDAPTSARLALFDRRWDLNRGPTNWYLWRKSSVDPHLQDPPESGGGVGLGMDGTTGGGHELYRVMDYDLHYAPNVVMSRKGQPWCTERFEVMPSACVYQMYLSGAEMWVLPDEWTFTIEEIEKKPEGWKDDPAEKLKNSISSRLYGKFHQEACMHYGREFLSIQQWNSEKAQNLRQACAKTLSTWGMGLASS